MYEKTSNTIWSGRSDPEDGAAGKRWHEVIQIIDLKKEQLPALEEGVRGVVLLGFICDEGVTRNKGRPGAARGPEAIRKALSGFPVHFETDAQVLWDGGDIRCVGGDLKDAQVELGRLVSSVLDRGYFPLVLGGGHEVAWGTFQGIRLSEAGPGKAGIINLDAHFDLRLPTDAGASSGTPFYQIADWFRRRGRLFQYLVIGIQELSNTRALFERAGALGVTYITAASMSEDHAGSVNKLDEFIKRTDRIYLTICMDVFNASFAPGVSAPNPLGIQPNDALELIRIAKATGKIVVADIAEMNPIFDIDQRTARLAAALIFELIVD